MCLMNRFWLKLPDGCVFMTFSLSGSFSIWISVLLSGLLPLAAAPPQRFMNIQAEHYFVYLQHHRSLDLCPTGTLTKLLPWIHCWGEWFCAYLLFCMYDYGILGSQGDPCPDRSSLYNHKLNMQHVRDGKNEGTGKVSWQTQGNGNGGLW